jgi:predicted ATP-binding protein involved in virulence
MIKTLKVRNLNSRINLDVEFNTDLNLLTGKNGSSKTTLLKLIWYLNGGQLYNLIKEINFEFAELETTSEKISVKRDKEKGLTTITIGDTQPQTINDDNVRELEMRHPKYRKIYNELRKKAIPTIFFPTFRRIEGGFNMEFSRQEQFYPDSLKDAMSELSSRLSIGNQKFVASISTDDIVSLITQQYADINTRVNAIQKRQSDSIIEKIKFRNNQEESAILDSIQRDIENMEASRQEYFKPFNILSTLILKIFQHKGILLNNLTLGDLGEAISSEKLSAGEKQMLSFLCYNTFTQQSTIFIDEPELSLHPDWQRTLVPTLLEQGNNNQFFMATHSPFIYAKYPDKEIMLGNDKGDN